MGQIQRIWYTLSINGAKSTKVVRVLTFRRNERLSVGHRDEDGSICCI